MADLTGINVFLNKDDVNDVSISPVGDGTYELRIGDFIITARSYLELKTLCLNVQSAFEKTLRFSNELARAKTTPETIKVIHEGLARLAGAK